MLLSLQFVRRKIFLPVYLAQLRCYLASHDNMNKQLHLIDLQDEQDQKHTGQYIVRKFYVHYTISILRLYIIL